MKKILYPTLTILLCLMAIACHNDKNQQFATPSMKVDLFVVATDSNAVSHNYVGKVLAASDIPLSFALGGQLTSINVTNGQHVSKGQIIATVDNTQQKNMLESCNALLRQAQDGYARVEKVHEKGGVSDVKWVDIQTQLAKAQSAAQSAQKNFDDCTLRATMSGVVNLEDVHVGQRLLPGESLGTLLGNGSMRAEFTVPETGSVKILGTRNEEIAITLDVDHLSQYAIDKKLIAAQLAAQGFRTITGSIDGAGGRILNGNRLANVGVEAAQFKAQVSERDILQEVEETYWLLSGLYEKRHTVTQVRQLLDTISLVAQTAFDAGVVTNNDLLKVQLKKNEIETQALRLENGIRLATHALCHQLGIPVQDSLPLQSLPTENIAELQLNTAINPQHRPEYHLLDLNVKAEELRRQLILGEALPTLAIGGSVSTSNLFEQNRNNAIVFAVASIPLSEWWNTSHKIKEADIKVQEAQLMRDDLQGKMHLQNEQVYNALTEAARLMGQHQSAILMTQDNYDLSLANYEAGLATMSELLESQALLLQAQNNYTDSRITYRTNLRKFKQLNK